MAERAGDNEHVTGTVVRIAHGLAGAVHRRDQVTGVVVSLNDAARLRECEADGRFWPASPCHWSGTFCMNGSPKPSACHAVRLLPLISSHAWKPLFQPVRGGY